MADLESALANVPGLAGYLGQEQFTQRRNTAELANANQAATLQKHYDGLAKERGLRDALGRLGPEAKEEDVMRAVAPFVGADTAFKAIESKRAREAQLQANALIKGQQMDQRMQMFREQMDKLRLPEAERRRAEMEYKMRIQGANAEYALPSDILIRYGLGGAAPQQGAPVPAVGPQPMPMGGGAPSGPVNNPQEALTALLDPNLGADDSPAQKAEREAQIARLRAQTGPQATPAPPAPVAPPVEAPVAPQAVPEQAPDAGLLDARDIVARRTPAAEPPAAPIQGAPVARGETHPPQGAPVARGLPQPPPELEAAWSKLGRKAADMERAKWLAAAVKGTGGQVPGDFTKSGQEYLASLPESDRDLVKKIANYDVDPKTLETRGGQRSRMLSMVTKFDPTYDDTQYANKRRAIQQFGSGKQGDTVRSLNVAVEHIDTLKRAGEALKNGSFTPGNYAYNEFVKIFGQTPPNTFEGIRDIVANEVVKGTIGASGALRDREEAASKVKGASSPAQLNALMNSWTELMGGQIKGLERQYEGSTKLKDFRERYLTPRTVDAIGVAERRAGSAQGAPVSRFETGRVYTDAKGRKAKYLGDGKWEDQ